MNSKNTYTYLNLVVIIVIVDNTSMRISSFGRNSFMFTIALLLSRLVFLKPYACCLSHALYQGEFVVTLLNITRLNEKCHGKMCKSINQLNDKGLTEFIHLI